VEKIDVYHCASDRRQNSVWHKNAYRTYSIAGGMNGVNPNGGWEILPCIKYSDIKNPATKYVFLAECDPRGYNMGSWVMHPKSRQWVDPFAIWHSKNRSTLGWADGHVGMHRWLGRGLIEWNMRALYEPLIFQFYRNPNSDDELLDFEFALKGYAYKALQ
jgi:prepilin-type processing-associated H-X9-DG protein